MSAEAASLGRRPRQAVPGHAVQGRGDAHVRDHVRVRALAGAAFSDRRDRVLPKRARAAGDRGGGVFLRRSASPGDQTGRQPRAALHRGRDLDVLQLHRLYASAAGRRHRDRFRGAAFHRGAGGVVPEGARAHLSLERGGHRLHRRARDRRARAEDRERRHDRGGVRARQRGARRGRDDLPAPHERARTFDGDRLLFHADGSSP